MAAVKETLPSLASLNQSLYMVYAGYQDYFFDLYDKKVTPRQGLDTVPDVVSAIVDHIEVILNTFLWGVAWLLIPWPGVIGCLPIHDEQHWTWLWGGRDSAHATLRFFGGRTVDVYNPDPIEILRLTRPRLQ